MRIYWSTSAPKTRKTPSTTSKLSSRAAGNVVDPMWAKNSPPDEEGTPERSEGGEVKQLEHFRRSKHCWCLTSSSQSIFGSRQSFPPVVGATLLEECIVQRNEVSQ